jgi:hypothetical protein
MLQTAKGCENLVRSGHFDGQMGSQFPIAGRAYSQVVILRTTADPSASPQDDSSFWLAVLMFLVVFSRPVLYIYAHLGLRL